jgi:hypothetical protein
MSATVGCSEQTKKLIEQYGKARGYASTGEATDALVGTAVKRLNAVRKYAQAQAGGKPAPKAKAKKAAKAKGPIARKATKTDA